MFLARWLAPSRFPAPILTDKDRTMKAIVIHEHGDRDVMQYEDFPAPSPQGRQIHVKIIAAGVNPVDFKMRKGPVSQLVYPKPKVLGCDMSGIVLSAPEGAAFSVGESVYAMLPMLGSAFGSYAGECCVDESLLAPAVDNYPLEDLASLPLVACTVVQALRPVREAYGADIQGKKCFVQAGSGGLGSFAIQYCANVLGMQVTTSCSAKNAEFVRSLGATHVVDYKTQRVEDVVRDYDVFFDSMGYLSEDLVLQSESKILRRSHTQPGHYIRIASSPYGQNAAQTSSAMMSGDPLGLAIPEARLDRMFAGYFKQFRSYFNGIRYHFVLVSPERAALLEVNDALRAGKIRPVVQQRFPLEQASEAHRVIEEGHVVGKMVLIVNELPKDDLSKDELPKDEPCRVVEGVSS